MDSIRTGPIRLQTATAAPATRPRQAAAPAGDRVQLSASRDLGDAQQMQQMRRLAQMAQSKAAAPVRTGKIDYYRQRQQDFQRRHPGATPPDYYMNYGDKYARKFTQQLKPNLSESGQKWLDRTFVNLQEAIEGRRRDDPAGFARLEQDPEAFKKFAYGTHAKAYLDAGLADLPSSDLVKIGGTPEFKDLLSSEGIGQMGEVMSRIYEKRGLGYFTGKAAEAAFEYGNPVTGALNVGSTAASVLQSHKEAVVEGAGWVAAPGLMLAKKLFAD